MGTLFVECAFLAAYHTRDTHVLHLHTIIHQTHLSHMQAMMQVWTQYLDVIPRVRQVLWWLSVDNNGGSFHDFVGSAARGVVHASNSQYGIDYLASRRVPGALLLPDFVDVPLCGGGANASDPLAGGVGVGRGRVVAYNPSKGGAVTNRIIAALSASAGGQGVQMVPVQHVPSSAYILRYARVYIDFGHHPGQDRLPREAVQCGCTVITGTEGSASLYADVPLPAALKIRAPLQNLQDTVRRIQAAVDAYPTKGAEEMQAYRGFVAGQREGMLAATRALVRRVFDAATADATAPGHAPGNADANTRQAVGDFAGTNGRRQHQETQAPIADEHAREIDGDSDESVGDECDAAGMPTLEDDVLAAPRPAASEPFHGLGQNRETPEGEQRRQPRERLIGDGAALGGREGVGLGRSGCSGPSVDADGCYLAVSE